jgi:hypothetical protein
VDYKVQQIIRFQDNFKELAVHYVQTFSEPRAAGASVLSLKEVKIAITHLYLKVFFIYLCINIFVPVNHL